MEETKAKLEKSPSNPNMDLIDTIEMPNIRTSAEELSKEQRKPRPMSRQFDNSASRNNTNLKRNHTLEKTIEKEESTEPPAPPLPVANVEAERVIIPLKDVEGKERKGPIVLNSPEKKSYKEMAAGFFHLPFKPKKHSQLSNDDSPVASSEELRKASTDSLNGSTVLSATSDSSGAMSPPSATASENGGESYVKGKGLVMSPSSGSNMKDLTGYRSSKMALNNNEGSANFSGYRSSRMTMTMSPAEGSNSNTLASHSTYNAMSNLRQSRMSGMFGSSTNEKASPAQNPKTFKQYFKTLLEGHDNGQRDNMAITRRPKVFKLSAMFGLRGERTDPMQRLMWMSAYHESIKNDTAFMSRPKDGLGVTISKKPDASRILDLDLESSPNGIEIDTSQALGLELVVAGTEKGLLDRLMVPLYQDLSYPEVFLASYRFFISPMQVFHSLTEWYNVTSEGSTIPGAEGLINEHRKAIQVRSLRIIMLWIRNHWQDFLDNHGLWSMLRNFSQFLSQESFPDFQKIMHAIREERLSWMTSQYIPMFPGIQEKDSTAFWCPEVDVEKFAHDLTMLDHIFFRQMKPDVYLQMLSKPGTLQSGAYNIPLKGMFEYCSWFRMVASYPSALLAIQENTKKITMTIRLLIKIAKTCLDLGNLQGSFALIYGLKQPAALIWFSAWEALPAKSMDYYKAITNLMSHYEGYKNYWEYTQKLQPPAVPYLVPYLIDMVFLFENTPLLKNGTIVGSNSDEGPQVEEQTPKSEINAPEKIKKDVTVEAIQEEEPASSNKEVVKSQEPSPVDDLTKKEGETKKIDAKVEEDKKSSSEKPIEDSLKAAPEDPSRRRSKVQDSAIHAKLRQSKLFGNRTSMQGIEPPSRESKEDMINFQKFYDIFSVAAELERYRLSSYHHVIRSEKTSACSLLQHIRFVSKRDDASIGTSVTFGSGTLPDDNAVLNSEAAIKNIKKIVNLLAGKDE